MAYLLIVQQLLPCLGSIFGVRRFDNGIHRTAFLAEATVDTLGHINIVSCCPSATVLSFLGFDCDSLGGADL
jgi:hypothetical protein